MLNLILSPLILLYLCVLLFAFSFYTELKKLKKEIKEIKEKDIKREVTKVAKENK